MNLEKCAIVCDGRGKLEVLFDHSLKSDGAYYIFVPEINASAPPVRRFVDWVQALPKGNQAVI